MDMRIDKTGQNGFTAGVDPLRISRNPDGIPDRSNSITFNEDCHVIPRIRTGAVNDRTADERD
jgi:hypothetical protein